MSVKEYLKDKRYGFYFVLVTMLLSLITMIVYAVGYSKTRYMSWGAFAIILIGVVLVAILLALKLYSLAPAVLLTTNFVALLMFVYYIYFFISSVMTGIQFSGFPPEFIATTTFFVLMLVASIITVFVPIAKKTETHQ